MGSGGGSKMTEWSLSELTIALATIFALHVFIILPLLRRRLANVQDSGKPKWAVTVLVFETSRLMFLAALISACLTWGLLAFITTGTGASSASVTQAILRLQSFKDIVDDIKLGAWMWAFAFAAVALYYWIVRKRRSQFASARAAIFRDKLNRLIDEFNSGTLPPLDPTTPMSSLVDQIKTLELRIQEVTNERNTAE